MNIVIDFILKGVIGGAGQIIAKGIGKTLGLGLSDKMMAQIIISLAEALAKHTKNDIDNKIVSTWKKQVIESGIEIQ